jgi:hypothetical protein
MVPSLLDIGPTADFEDSFFISKSIKSTNVAIRD